jgi:2-haloacid dehalogenase
MPVRVCVFDLYGTLVDLSGLQGAVPADCDGEALIARWRAKQLEYSWTYTIMRRRADFESLAEQALDWTLASLGIDDRKARSAFLDAYAQLGAQPDAEPCLRELHELGFECAVLSNGSQHAIERALDTTRIAPLIDKVLSVESLGVFKPDPSVYQFAAEALGAGLDELAFQSANAWDAAGAAAAGLTVYWINRTSAPDEYGLRQSVTELPSLTALPPRLQSRIV